MLVKILQKKVIDINLESDLERDEALFLYNITMLSIMIEEIYSNEKI